MQHIAVVTPHYGDQALLDRMTEACKRQALEPGVQLRQFVIDSNPPAPRRLFTAAANMAIEAALQAGAEAVWLLNNDCIPDVWCCAAGVGKLVSGPRIGLVASKNVEPEGKDRITWGGSLECWPAGRHRTGRVSMGDCAVAEPQEWVTFASVFFRREALLEVGRLDDYLQHLCSDADWCLRAREKKWEIWYEPTSVVYHAFGSSHGKDGTPPWLKYAGHLDMIRFGRKHGFSAPDKKPVPNWQNLTVKDLRP